MQPFQSRLVMVSSAKHRGSKGLNLEDLHYHRNRKAYNPMAAYNDSKLADILFAKEYDRRQAASFIQETHAMVSHILRS